LHVEGDSRAAPCLAGNDDGPPGRPGSSRTRRSLVLARVCPRPAQTLDHGLRHRVPCRPGGPLGCRTLGEDPCGARAGLGVALQMLALDLAVRRGTVTPPRVAHIIQAMKALPGKAQEVLLRESEVASLAARLADREHMFFIGRGLDYAVAQEGSLKLKEISY